MVNLSTQRRLCRLRDLPATGAAGLPLPGGEEGWEDELIVLRQGAQVRAFRNRCPHTGAPLNWLPNQFFDLDERYLQCSLHLALFEPSSGHCVHGPCAGQALKAVAVVVSDGWVWLTS